jgi:NAD(P)-dependent dehydrogenase (short-subunit alcohol dehydrogenase family)
MGQQLIVLITGVTRGLGRALADEFAARGHVVWGCGRDPESVARCASDLPAPHIVAAVDVADSKSVEAWAARLLASGAAPDLVINNAALMNEPSVLWEVLPEEFSDMMNVNVVGSVNVIRAFVPALLRAGRGVVVNMSSGWGRSTAAEVGPYCASKYAVEGLTGSLADELPAPLAAVALNPGIIDTDMLRTVWGEAAGSYPSPSARAPAAVDLLMRLGREHNGKPLTV